MEPFRPVASLWQRWRTQRSVELAELTHLVEQLEQMGGAIARYRAGAGRLMEVQVPLRCVQVAANEHPETPQVSTSRRGRRA